MELKKKPVEIIIREDKICDNQGDQLVNSTNHKGEFAKVWVKFEEYNVPKRAIRTTKMINVIKIQDNG